MDLLGLAGPGDMFPQRTAVTGVEAADEALASFLECRSEKDPIVPDDRRRLPDSPDGSLPGNRIRRPLSRKIGRSRMSVAARTAPTRPILVGRGSAGRHQQ